MKGIDHIQREEQDSILFFLFFTLLYRVQYFLTLLLLVKRAGAGQIQSRNRNQVNFTEIKFPGIIGKRKSAAPLYRITGNGPYTPDIE